MTNESNAHTEYDNVYNSITGELLGTVDRSNAGGDYGKINVTLPCGHTESFWVMGLTNQEYVRRTQELKKIFEEEPPY